MTQPMTKIEQGEEAPMSPTEGADFIESMSASPYATVEMVSRTSNDAFDIYRVTVTEADDDAPTILVVGGQHGDEPVGWEAALRWMRDAAFSDSPVWSDLRQRTRFIFIPMSSPGSINITSRATPLRFGYYDSNRAHLNLQTNEARVIQQTITDFEPVMLFDCHEYYGGETATTVRPGLSGHPQADEQLLALAEELYASVEAGLDDQEIPNMPYALSTGVDTLRNVATLRHALSFLIETPYSNPSIPPSQRAEWFMIVITEALKWIQGNLTRVIRGSHGARQHKTQEGAERSKPFNLLTSVLDPPPVGYFGVDDWPESLDVLGIEKTENMILMEQPGQPLIPYIFDHASEYAIITAHRYSPRTQKPPQYTHSGEPEAIRANIEGITHEIEEVRLGTPNGTMTIWTKTQP